MTELERRNQEALKLYEPLPHQQEYHECKATTVICLGGNRAGKTLAVMVEIARCVTDQDPYKKTPEVAGQKLQIIIGKDWDHIGNVIFPYLFREGAFYIIEDQATKKYRAWKPWDPADVARKSERKPAPPLIPKRFIKPKSWAWVSKGKRQFKKVELTTGWEIRAYSSEGDPPQGFKALRVNIDEDISREDWVPEMRARLSDLKGCFHWSAMPHSKCDSLVRLADQAEDQLTRDNPNTIKFEWSFLDNPFIDEDEKKKRVEELTEQGEDELMMRIHGRFLTGSRLVYPSFSRELHSIAVTDLPNNLKAIPPDWTRYAFIDPGFGTCAALFLAVPPPRLKWDHVVVEDELYLPQCDAEMFAERMKQKVEGRCYQAFVLDMQGGRISDMGTGQPVWLHYRKALEKRNVKSEWSGSGFLPGSTDIPGRLAAVRLWLRVQPDGLPTLLILKHEHNGLMEYATPNLLKELKKYRRKTAKVNGTEITLDEPQTRGPCHAVQCLEYAAAFAPRYVEQKKPVPVAVSGWEWLEKIKRKRKAEQKGLVVNLGPASH